MELQGFYIVKVVLIEINKVGDRVLYDLKGINYVQELNWYKIRYIN